MSQPTPRIDTLRNQLHATIELLTMLAEELDDLHVLAYERHTARQDVAAVNGGATDYALDTHGNPRARQAYRDLALAAVHVCKHIATTTHDAITVLRDHDHQRPKTPRTIRAEELAEAIDAQARRAERGEYTPVRREPQPDREPTIRALRSDLATLRQPWTNPDVVYALSERLTIPESQARDLLRWLTDTITSSQKTQPKRTRKNQR